MFMFLFVYHVLQYDWPSLSDEPDSKETQIVYEFAYLPAGLFNRAQVRLYQFADSNKMWKTGSILLKNKHVALIQQTKYAPPVRSFAKITLFNA